MQNKCFLPLLVGITMYRVMSDTMDQFAFSKRPLKQNIYRSIQNIERGVIFPLPPPLTLGGKRFNWFHFIENKKIHFYTCKKCQAITERKWIVGRDESKKEDRNWTKKGDSTNQWISIWNSVSDPLWHPRSSWDTQQSRKCHHYSKPESSKF